jgi:hypothetical protein
MSSRGHLSQLRVQSCETRLDREQDEIDHRLEAFRRTASGVSGSKGANSRR